MVSLVLVGRVKDGLVLHHALLQEHLLALVVSLGRRRINDFSQFVDGFHGEIYLPHC